MRGPLGDMEIYREKVNPEKPVTHPRLPSCKVRRPGEIL